MPNVNNINVLELARGAIMEQIDIELRKVVENLTDPNTDWKAARSLEIKLTFKNNNEGRQIVDVRAQAKAKTVPNNAIVATLITEQRPDGPHAAEYNTPGQIPGQASIDQEMGNDTTNVINMRRRA